MAVHPERASRSQVVEALLVAHLAADARLAQEDAYAKESGRGGMMAEHALAWSISAWFLLQLERYFIPRPTDCLGEGLQKTSHGPLGACSQQISKAKACQNVPNESNPLKRMKQQLVLPRKSVSFECDWEAGPVVAYALSRSSAVASSAAGGGWLQNLQSFWLSTWVTGWWFQILVCGLEHGFYFPIYWE